jgi:hypothetical protein
VKYFFDNCISSRLADMLCALGEDVTHLSTEFPKEIDDRVFLRRLKGRYDVYLTYDHKQKTRKAEARAIKEAGLTALWFAPFWGGLDFWAQAKWLITRWERIDQFANSAVLGTCAEVRHSGRADVFQL